MPAFLGTVVGLNILLAAIRWLLSIKYHIVDLNQDLWNLYFPIFLPAIPCIFWLRKKLRILEFTKDNEAGRFWMLFVCWTTTSASAWYLQKHLDTSTGTLLTVKNVGAIKHPPARYYRISSFYVLKNNGLFHANLTSAGRHGSRLDMNLYFVAPMVNDSNDSFQASKNCWYGILFKKQVSNEDEVSNAGAYHAFRQECLTRLENECFDAPYFENLPNSNERAQYVKAIGESIGNVISDNVLILEPRRDLFEERSGDSFAWIFGSFGIGLLVFLISLLLSSYNIYEYEIQKMNKEDL